MSFKSGFESRERVAAVLNDRLANDVRRNGTHSSGTDDDRVLRALVRNDMCWLRYCGDDVCSFVMQFFAFGCRIGDGHTVMIRTCSVTDWGSQCGDIFFEQGDEVERLRGCLATCDFDGCNGAPSTTEGRGRRRLLVLACASILAVVAPLCTGGRGKNW